MASYIIIGLLWASGLEFYTTEKLNADWSYRTRIVHTLTWPIQMIIFIVTFLNQK
jgi:hypothetical protein